MHIRLHLRIHTYICGIWSVFAFPSVPPLPLSFILALHWHSYATAYTCCGELVSLAFVNRHWQTHLHTHTHTQTCIMRTCKVPFYYIHIFVYANICLAYEYIRACLFVYVCVYLFCVCWQCGCVAVVLIWKHQRDWISECGLLVQPDTRLWLHQCTDENYNIIGLTANLDVLVIT